MNMVVVVVDDEGKFHLVSGRFMCNYACLYLCYLAYFTYLAFLAHDTRFRYLVPVREAFSFVCISLTF